MRKFKVAFAATMLMIMALTAGVMGYSGTKYVGTEPYYIKSLATRAIFRAIGESGNSSAVSYSTIYNRTDTPYSMQATVSEYKYAGGLKNSQYYRATARAGEVVESGDITRHYNDTSYYYLHNGYVFVATGANSTYETYSYTADQRG